MLAALVDRLQSRGVRYLEATVAPSNTASDRLFRGFAKKRGCPLERTDYFTEDLFGAGAHEPEYLYRIDLGGGKSN